MECSGALKARMAGPQRMSATELDREAGIPQPTLSKWLREAGRVKSVRPEKPAQGR